MTTSAESESRSTWRALRFTPDVKNNVLFYKRKGYSVSGICKILFSRHSVKCSRQGVRNFLNRFSKTGKINDTKRRKRDGILKVKEGHKQFIDLWMSKNPELNAKAIKKKLKEIFNLNVSVATVNRIRKQLGWTGKRTTYCQLISAGNMLKRERWALDALSTYETFSDVVFVDETSIEMSTSGRFRFYKLNSALDNLPSKAPKPKHSYKVHMWAGISYMGRTDCCVFTGIMDSVIYQQILERNFLPFVRRTHPNGFRLYQDNDSKHCSRSTKAWMENQGIEHNVMKTPASSPDINPIENVWSALKDYLQKIVKPRRKEELVNGIKAFWESLSPQKCAKYIDHIHKVLPEVCLNRGGPTQY